MNERERLLRVLDRQPVDRVPAVSPNQTATVDLMEASGAFWPEAHRRADLMTRLSLAAREVAGLEGCRVPFDQAVDASAFGARTVREAEDRPPVVAEPAVPVEDMGSLDIPDPRRDGRAPVVLEAVRSLHSALGRESPVLCGVTGPFTLSCQLRGEAQAMMDLLTAPHLVAEAAEKAAEWCLVFSREIILSGADVIVLMDPSARGDVLSPEQYEEFALPYQKRVAAAVREAGARTILHICGDNGRNLEPMRRSGAHGVSVDQDTDLRTARSVLGETAVIGNVPTSSLQFHSPEMVERECLECLQDGTDVLAPGCGLAPGTPLQNLQAMVATARRWRPKSP